MAQIKDSLIDFNPWWKGKFEIEFKEREAYRKIRKFMPLRQMLALTGLRRVGKTTIMLKVADDSINKGFDPKHIMYFSFDEFKTAEIREVMRAYEDMMNLEINKGKYLLLLDEIQKLRNWEDQLKAIYDTFRNIKIIVSGSESLFIRKKSKETLAGRMFDFKVELLSFREFLWFKGADFKPTGIYRQELARLFAEFTLSLGFPELVGLRDKEVIKKYVRESIVDKIVYKDMPGLFKIKDISVIEALLNILMEEPGQVMDLSELAGELKISRQALSNYLSYLEESFLIRKLYNFSRSRRKVERKLKRYYPALVSVDLLFKEDEYNQSKIFECLIINQLKAEFFWRDPYKNEVDIILPGKEPVPLEIKYGKTDAPGLVAFMKRFKVSRGYVLSRDKEQTQKVDGKT